MCMYVHHLVVGDHHTACPASHVGALLVGAGNGKLCIHVRSPVWYVVQPASSISVARQNVFYSVQ